jgi:hypothetical protein
MKSILLIGWFMLTVFLFSSFLVSAQGFSGIITYEITYTGSGVTESLKYTTPSTMYLTIKGNKARFDMGAWGKWVIDGDARKTITFLYTSENIAVISTAEDISKALEKEPKTRTYVTSETRDILGYTCKKAIIVIMGEDKELTAYYTPEIGSATLHFDNNLYKGINGMMLEYEEPYEQGGYSMHYKAISIEKKDIPDTQFTIPEGFKIMTPEEVKEMY